ncbi:MAG: hypothetical protein ACYC1C_14140 [Chloroflexota bacterium]
MPPDVILQTGIATPTGEEVAFLLLFALLYATTLFVLYRKVSRDGKITDEAQARADQLLHELLSTQEQSQIKVNGYLEVPSRIYADRVYHIPERAGAVSVFTKGVLTERLCIGPATPVPDGDAVLANKLWIEASEEEYLQVANRLPPYN